MSAHHQLAWGEKPACDMIHYRAQSINRDCHENPALLPFALKRKLLALRAAIPALLPPSQILQHKPSANPYHVSQRPHHYPLLATDRW